MMEHGTGTQRNTEEGMECEDVMKETFYTDSPINVIL